MRERPGMYRSAGELTWVVGWLMTFMLSLINVIVRL